ncbi:MAG: hypothetical protein Ct9H90mP16_19920 [Candidatus Poseidoniales archaeon]|nr:MAG: hypothetical protein Ct9H90mP16_19920 [Candidatus Poseidoniales archaeon]
MILELTAQYDLLKNQCEAGNDEDSCNDIPEQCYVSSQTNLCHDWRVGHGLVHVGPCGGFGPHIAIATRFRWRRIRRSS